MSFLYDLSRLHWQLNPLIILPLAGTVLAVFLARYGWQHRQRPGAPLYIAAQQLVAVVALAQAFQFSRTDYATVMFASRLGTVGIAILPVLLVLAMLPVGLWRYRLASLLVALLSLVPAGTLYFYVLHEPPNLMLASAALLPVAGYLELRLTPGPWFWVHTAYSYSLVLAGLVLVGERLVHLPMPYRRTPLWALAGLLVVNFAHVGINFGLLRGQSSDLVSAVTISGFAVILWVAFRYSVFDIVPMARAQVLQHLPLGVITLDAAGDVLDANLAALYFLGVPLAELVHRPARQALAVLPPLIAALDSDHSSVELGNDASLPQPYEVTVIPVRNGRGELGGTALVVRDISAELEARARLRELASYIPVCAWCGKARTHGGSWQPLATWLRHEGGVVVSHVICDDCRQHYERDPDWAPSTQRHRRAQG